MPLLRLNEHYTSIQGEGPNTGKLTQFVRFSGCNMRCPGWPCDTQHAILPELYRGDPKLDPEVLAFDCVNKALSTGASHVCITGGEPFMQDSAHLGTLVKTLLRHGVTVDIFTNGSFDFPMWITEAGVTVVMDWKLPGSGEAATRVETRAENLQLLGPKDAVKFVVKDQHDLDHIKKLIEAGVTNARCQIWIGRVWESELTNDDLIKFLNDNALPWSLNVQMHKYLWPDIERGI